MGEEITYEEACKLSEGKKSDILSYVIAIINEATEDEEERANLKVNFATHLAQFESSTMLRGILADGEEYISSLIPKEYEGAIFSLEEARENLIP